MLRNIAKRTKFKSSVKIVYREHINRQVTRRPTEKAIKLVKEKIKDASNLNFNINEDKMKVDEILSKTLAARGGMSCTLNSLDL